MAVNTSTHVDLTGRVETTLRTGGDYPKTSWLTCGEADLPSEQAGWWSVSTKSFTADHASGNPGDPGGYTVDWERFWVPLSQQLTHQRNQSQEGQFQGQGWEL